MDLKVIRMEDFNGRGPFSNGHVYSILNEHDFNPYLSREVYPDPYVEKLIKSGEDLFQSHWYCGVLEIDMFFHWFPKEQMSMYEKLESYISLYRVTDPDNIRIGSKQVIFRRDRSQILNKVKPTNWIFLENI